MGFFDLFKDEQSEVNQVEDTEFAVDEDTEFASEASMRLREEELDIHKDQVKTGEVMLHKEVVEEQKTVDVPVGHEQVVIKEEHLSIRLRTNRLRMKKPSISLLLRSE